MVVASTALTQSVSIRIRTQLDISTQTGTLLQISTQVSTLIQISTQISTLIQISTQTGTQNAGCSDRLIRPVSLS